MSTAATRPSKPPLAIDADGFMGLPEDWRREARARTAFLVMRGAVPALAFEKAVAGMVLDQSEQEYPATWETVLTLCQAWPLPSRHPTDGTPRPGAFSLAASVDSLAEAHAMGEADEDPRAILEQFEPCSDAHVLAAAMSAYETRLRTLCPEAPEPEAPAAQEDGPQPDGGESWIDDASDHYFREW